jgi:tetratricopeptide (TPR) repeat protein
MLISPDTAPRRLAVIAILLILTACSGAESRLQEHLELAQGFYDQADYQKARLEYKNALQIDPDNVAAFYALGKTMEQLQDIRSAVANFRRVLELDATHVDARVRLAYTYLAAKARAEAQKLCDEGMALDPEHPELLALRGNIKAVEGDLAGALADGEAALARDSSSEQAIRLVAALYRQQNQPEKSLALLRDGVDHNPESIPLQMILVNAYAEHGDNDAAIALYRRLIERQPDNLSHRLQLARFLARLERPDDAEQVLRDGVRDIPASVPAKLALVEFLYMARDMDKAEQELLAIIKREPKEYQLRSALASLYEKSGESDKAQAVYREVIALDAKGEEGIKSRTRLAHLLIKAGDPKGAGALVNEVVELNPNDAEALTFRGQLALDQGDADRAIADFRTVLKDQPDSPAVLRMLARALLANNESDLARDEMRKAVALAPDEPQLRLELAQIDLRAGDLAAARDQLARVLDTLPNHPEALAAMFRISLVEKDLKGAHEYARMLKASYPDSALGYYLAGQAYQAEKKLAQSQQEYETALAKSSPAELQPLAGLVAVHLLQGERDKARARLDRALEAAPDSPLLHNMKGELLLGGKQFDAALAAFDTAIGLEPKFAAGYRNLALARLAMGDKDGAVAAYRSGIRANPGDAALTTQLASLYEGLGRHDEAIEVYRELLAKDPGSLMASNNLAMLLATYRDDKQSLEQAASLSARLAASDNPNYLDTVGWVSYRRGDVDAAISVLERAVARAPESPVIRYHLGKAYHVKGDAAQARANLERALQLPEPFAGKDDAEAILTALADT